MENSRIYHVNLKEDCPREYYKSVESQGNVWSMACACASLESKKDGTMPNLPFLLKYNEYKLEMAKSNMEIAEIRCRIAMERALKEKRIKGGDWSDADDDRLIMDLASKVERIKALEKEVENIFDKAISPETRNL